MVGREALGAFVGGLGPHVGGLGPYVGCLGAYVGSLGPLLGPKLMVLAALGRKSGPNRSGKAGNWIGALRGPGPEFT